jgi:riboflavin synthase
VWQLRVNDDLGEFIAAKGSVTLDGVSLTVNTVEDRADGTWFAINLIPHTLQHTNFAERALGDRLNMEVDLLARYLARFARADRSRERLRDAGK